MWQENCCSLNVPKHYFELSKWKRIIERGWNLPQNLNVSSSHLTGFSNFIIMLGFYIPFIFLANVAVGAGITIEKANLLVAIIGVANTFGNLFRESNFAVHIKGLCDRVTDVLVKWAILCLFFIYFRSTVKKLHQINVKNDPSSMWYRDSNPQPLDHQSPPITTRPLTLPDIFVYTISVDGRDEILFVLDIV